jgi:hypothetical protein
VQSEATTLEEYARQQKLLLQRIQSLQDELQAMQESERLLLEDREDMRIQLDACAEGWLVYKTACPSPNPFSLAFCDR